MSFCGEKIKAFAFEIINFKSFSGHESGGIFPLILVKAGRNFYRLPIIKMRIPASPDLQTFSFTFRQLFDYFIMRLMPETLQTLAQGFSRIHLLPISTLRVIHFYTHWPEKCVEKLGTHSQ